jgi:hypothetical protein
MWYFGATARRDGINNLVRNSVENAMATFPDTWRGTAFPSVRDGTKFVISRSFCQHGLSFKMKGTGGRV